MRTPDTKTLTAAACMGAGMNTATVEKLNRGVDLNAAHNLGITRISDIFAACGFGYRPGHLNDMDHAMRAAFSSSDIGTVLSDVVEKFMLAGFGAAGADWKQVTRATNVHDFREVKGVRLVLGGTLQPLAKGGELQHVQLSDESQSVQAATKGSIIGISREDLINDDLGVLATVPQHFGMMASRTLNKDVFGSLSTTAGDYGASTTGALSLATLGTAYGLAMGIRDTEGNPIGPMPNKILVSSSNYLNALNIYQSEQLTGGSTRDAKTNVLRGVLEPITSPYLTGTSYWLYNSMFPLVNVAFLNGKQTPTIEAATARPDQLGIQMRCYFDYGVGVGDRKAALYSTGA